MVDYPYKSARDVPRGTPTPTQEELDAIKRGEHPELAADGSGPDPLNEANEEARKKAFVTHRQGQATHTTQARPAAPKA